jgi:hypothetical protein
LDELLTQAHFNFKIKGREISEIPKIFPSKSAFLTPKNGTENGKRKSLEEGMIDWMECMDPWNGMAKFAG